ncbi:hypothetical protein B0H34DRAFT_790085 [Crassisporium funariophilum]|nr:hypothetical protein B0H34DRAFT_790085 [Crassisporium funariophilum]
MRNNNVLNLRRSLPCMSWSPKNLYNLWKRTVGPGADEISFKLTRDSTLFQQRWKSKAAVRAYHGDYIPEKSFKRWYLPDNLPDVRPRRQVLSGDNMDLELFARRKLREKEQEDEIEAKGLAPVGSLMFSEVERRIDVFVFRACFAHSVYEARRLIIHGDVLLNGKKHTNATTRLAPGDMVSVNPDAIRFFKPQNGEFDDVNASTRTSTTTTSAKEDAKATSKDEVSTSEHGVSEEVIAEATVSEVSASESTPEESAENTEKVTLQEGTGMVHKRKLKGSKEPLTPFFLPTYAAPWLFIPAYIEPSFSTCSAVYVRHPTARPGYSEIPTPYDADGTLIRYAWEWYVQRRSRMRSKAQLARMPEDRALKQIQDVHEERRKLRMELLGRPTTLPKETVQK